MDWISPSGGLCKNKDQNLLGCDAVPIGSQTFKNYHTSSKRRRLFTSRHGVKSLKTYFQQNHCENLKPSTIIEMQVHKMLEFSVQLRQLSALTLLRGVSSLIQ
jgi:hypothetical protein